MALTDIVFQAGELQDFTLVMERGNTGVVVDIVGNTRTGYDALISELVLQATGSAGAVNFAY